MPAQALNRPESARFEPVQNGPLADQPLFGLRQTDSSFVAFGECLSRFRLLGEGSDAPFGLGDLRFHLFDDTWTICRHALDPVDLFGCLSLHFIGEQVRAQQRAANFVSEMRLGLSGLRQFADAGPRSVRLRVLRTSTAAAARLYFGTPSTTSRTFAAKSLKPNGLTISCTPARSALAGRKAGGVAADGGPTQAALPQSGRHGASRRGPARNRRRQTVG
ncbi:hypothetical protein ACFKHW_00145 [Bradyrhizobium lupini]|uniref:hypothetical protein n=1 Tax=Rhizobium lupini TaxID=136996 RepID=UPI00366CC095